MNVRMWFILYAAYALGVTVKALSLGPVGGSFVGLACGFLFWFASRPVVRWASRE